MASTPDPNPDSPPAGAPDDIERVSPGHHDVDGVEEAPGRDDVDGVEDTPGTDGGTSGTGGTNHRQDRDITS